MKDKCLTFTRRALPFLLGAVVSLAIAQAIDLGYQTLGNGPGSAAPIIGDSVGLLACTISAFFAFRQIRGGRLSGC
jgi:hypothetical protein